MTAQEARQQRLLPDIFRGEHFTCDFSPPSNVTVPSLLGAGFRFAVAVTPGTPLVTVTGTLTADGQVTNPSGNIIRVVVKKVGTELLTVDTDHVWTLYVTPSGDEEYVWASGNVNVADGAGALP